MNNYTGWGVPQKNPKNPENSEPTKTTEANNTVPPPTTKPTPKTPSTPYSTEKPTIFQASQATPVRMTESDLTLWWKMLMAFVTEKKVTDIIFSPEQNVVFCRINTMLEVYQTLSRENYNQVLLSQTPKEKQSEIKTVGESDFAVTIHGRRLRVNIYKSLKGLAGAFRPLPFKSMPWRDNGIPEAVISEIENTKQGLVLVTGPTGSGKSTTICSILEHLNDKYPYHIITIEDPIEYIFTNKKSAIDQREVGDHTESFQKALRASLRENPDIIFVGEIRDYETARTALMAADTGHLVFGTLHTRRVYSTISRLLEMAPESNREEIRAMLSTALNMVVCQRLLQRKGGGIFPCREVMMLCPAITALIKERKEKGINSQLIINQQRGMMEWGRALELAVEGGHITKEEAEKYRDKTEDI